MLVSHYPNRTQLQFYLDKFAKPLLILHPKRCTAMQWACLFFDTRRKKGRIFILDASTLKDPRTTRLLEEFEARHIYGFPALLIKLKGMLGGASARILTSITSTLLTGEKITPSVRHSLEEALPKSEILSAYATAEARIIGVPCTALMERHPLTAAQVFHPVAEGDVHIVEADENGVGEIAVLTPEFGYYLTGDAGKMIEEPCACEATKTLTVYGRVAFDLIHCLGATFHIAEVERVFSSLSSYVEDFYLEIGERTEDGKTRGFLTINAVPTRKLKEMKLPERFIGDLIESHLQVTKTRTLRDLIEDGVFMPSQIVLVPSIAHPGKKVHMRKIESPVAN